MKVDIYLIDTIVLPRFSPVVDQPIQSCIRIILEFLFHLYHISSLALGSGKCAD